MAYETIKLEKDDRGVLTLTFNRPEKHNAMNAQFITDMRAALKEIEADDSVRVVVLTGAGESFCAGGDLGWMKQQVAKTRQQRIEETQELASMLAEINSLSKPTIGRINGQAFGGGIGMISVCDVTFGARGAKFALTEVRLGLIPATISPFVVRRMGEANSRRTFFNCRFFDTDEAVALNLISEAVDPADLDAAVEKEIKLILGCAPGAIAMTKELVHNATRMTDAELHEYTARRLADAWETDEGKEGINAFLNKELPSWRK
mgnify:CR=1 FL=1